MVKVCISVLCVRCYKNIVTSFGRCGMELRLNGAVCGGTEARWRFVLVRWLNNGAVTLQYEYTVSRKMNEVA